MSSDKQDASPEQQRKAIRDGTERQGRLVVREYFDDGISGDNTTKRRGFLQMIRDASERGDFREIWVWDQDRFGRFDSIEAGFYVHPLRCAGIKLVTIAEGPVDWDDFTGRVMFSLKTEGKHQFLRDLSRNVTRGMIDAAKSAKMLYPCYGYTVADGTYIPDPQTAPVVVRIFDLYVNHNQSLRAIAALLTAEGIASPSSGTWTAGGVSGILTRRKYTGAYTWGQTQQGSYHAATAEGIVKRTRGQHHAAAVGIVIADHHPALVTIETFEAAQVKLADNRERTSPFSLASPYQLTGLLWCKDCGGRMNGSAGHYICTNYATRGKAACHHNRVKEAGLVPAIVDVLQRELLAPEALDALKAELRRQVEAEHTPIDAKEPERLRKQIAALDRRIDQGAERCLGAPSSLTTTLYAKLETLQTERSGLQARLNALEARTEASDGDGREIDQAIEALWTLREAFAEAPAANQRDLLRAVVSRVDCFFDHQDHGKLSRTTFTRAEITPQVVTVPSGLSSGVGSTP
jgi:DNA invertase Pin-like site-specific DNA recombinase